MEVFLCILIPFIGTTLGAFCVFFMKREMSEKIRRILTGFAAGVMVAASIWSLIVPAIEQSEGMGRLSFIPAVIGFWIGVLFLLLLDKVIPHLHAMSGTTEGVKSSLAKTTMMVLAVTLHNIIGENRHQRGECSCPLDRNSDTEFSGGSYHLNAAEKRGDEKDACVCRRCTLGHS